MTRSSYGNVTWWDGGLLTPKDFGSSFLTFQDVPSWRLFFSEFEYQEDSMGSKTVRRGFPLCGFG